MVLQTLTDFYGGAHGAVCSCAPEPEEELLQSAQEAAYLVVDWPQPASQALAVLGSRLVVPEGWAQLFPEAGLLISSAMSGGEIRQRFQDAAAHRQCWLQLQPMAVAFSLPCPDGQGVPVSELPKSDGFYSEALGCRYVHTPQQVILFDTEETLEQKIRLAQACGFAGMLTDKYPPDGH